MDSMNLGSSEIPLAFPYLQNHTFTADAPGVEGRRAHLMPESRTQTLSLRDHCARSAGREDTSGVSIVEQQVKPLPAGLESHAGASSSPMCLGKQQQIAQVHGPLPPTGDSQVKP